MIRTGITNDSLLDLSPALQNYYPQGQTTYQEQIDEALRQIIRELKKNRKDIKKYCTPLELQSSVSKSASFTGSAVADNLERMLWQVEFQVMLVFVVLFYQDAIQRQAHLKQSEVYPSPKRLQSI